MMKMKKTIPLILTLVVLLMLTVTACGESNATNTPASTENSAAAETASSGTETAAVDDGSLQRVLDAGKLTIGVEGNWIPYVYNEEGTGDLTGFEVDIAKEIASRLGVEAEFDVSDSWDPVIAGLDADRYDCVICGVNPSPTRQESYALSIPYAENPFCLVVAGDNDTITSFDDLAGKVCANSLTSTAGDIARNAGATLVEADLTGAMDMISTGRADATVNNVAAVEEYMEERPDVNVKIAAVYQPAADESWIIQSSAMFRQDEQTLCDKVNEIIQDMIDDGTCYNLTVEYFGQTVADNTSIYQ